MSEKKNDITIKIRFHIQSIPEPPARLPPQAYQVRRAQPLCTKDRRQNG
ncbi:MAG: hypothetical protein IPM31_17880 [Anaerolineae bacterium]|nr:hypothetical protein [Anaerolineae bacterium]